jgi:hypothetical protein
LGLHSSIKSLVEVLIFLILGGIGYKYLISISYVRATTRARIARTRTGFRTYPQAPQAILKVGPLKTVFAVYAEQQYLVSLWANREDAETAAKTSKRYTVHTEEVWDNMQELDDHLAALARAGI